MSRPAPDVRPWCRGYRWADAGSMRPTPTDPLRSIDWDQPIHADGTLTLRAVARLLARFRIGAVLVTRDAVPPHMAGERDIVGAVAAGIDLDDAVAADITHLDLVTADVNDTVLDVSRRLLDEGVRHVAVVDGDEIVAMVSMRDLLTVFVESYESSATQDDETPRGDAVRNGNG